jgi:intracellular sulfur oxidation DsrE/DsrF family protein
MFKCRFSTFNTFYRCFRYAVGEEVLQQRKVQKLAEMGFEAAQCEAALRRTNWNEEQALELIMGGL